MHTFKIILNDTPENTVKYIKTEIISNSGSFDGDEHYGTFSGKGIQGEYTTSDDTVTITILKKPFWASYNMIEKEIRKYFPK